MSKFQIEKRYYEVSDVANLLGCEIKDVYHLIEIGDLIGAVYVQDLPVVAYEWVRVGQHHFSLRVCEGGITGAFYVRQKKILELIHRGRTKLDSLSIGNNGVLDISSKSPEEFDYFDKFLPSKPSWLLARGASNSFPSWFIEPSRENLQKVMNRFKLRLEAARKDNLPVEDDVDILTIVDRYKEGFASKKIRRLHRIASINSEFYRFYRDRRSHFINFSKTEFRVKTVEFCVVPRYTRLAEYFSKNDLGDDVVLTESARRAKVHDWGHSTVGIESIRILKSDCDVYVGQMKKDHVQPPPREAHGNKERFAATREEVLGAALSVLASFRGQCVNQKGEVEATKLAGQIDEKGPLFWPKDGRAPLERNGVEKLLGRWLAKTRG